MSLPDLAAVKRYLRIETSVQDTLLAELLTRAKALIEQKIGVPLEAAEREMIDEATTEGRPVRRLQLPLYPVDAETIEIVDVDEVAVDDTTYTVRAEIGQIVGKPGTVFPNGPYTITADVGLSASPDYESRLEALASSLIIDVVAEWYANRNPGVTSESTGGGIAKARSGEQLPPRVMGQLYLLTPAGLG